jgi:hypothetical protein
MNLGTHVPDGERRKPIDNESSTSSQLGKIQKYYTMRTVPKPIKNS